MHKLADTALFLAQNYRTKAYLQAMIDLGVTVPTVILLPGDEPGWDTEESYSFEYMLGEQSFEFQPAQSIEASLEQLGCRVIEARITDINDPEMVQIISELNEEVLLYSGLGGVLLRKPLFEIGKQYLHIHGGRVPDYRGSTAFYYSILHENTIGASAIWLNEGIDTGNLIHRHSCPPPQGINIDLVVDPMLRALVLQKVFKDRLECGYYTEGEEVTEEGRTYQVIHPVLKHLALQKCALVPESE